MDLKKNIVYSDLLSPDEGDAALAPLAPSPSFVVIQQAPQPNSLGSRSTLGTCPSCNLPCASCRMDNVIACCFSYCIDCSKSVEFCCANCVTYVGP